MFRRVKVGSITVMTRLKDGRQGANGGYLVERRRNKTQVITSLFRANLDAANEVFDELVELTRMEQAADAAREAANTPWLPPDQTAAAYKNNPQFGRF